MGPWWKILMMGLMMWMMMVEIIVTVGLIRRCGEGDCGTHHGDGGIHGGRLLRYGDWRLGRVSLSLSLRAGFLKKREKEIAAVGLRWREVTTTAVHGGGDECWGLCERE